MRSRLRSLLTRRRAWTASVVWMAVIFGFSSLPGSAVPGGIGGLGHFVAYAILGGLLLIAFAHETHEGGRALSYAVITASLYGITDELHQAFVPGRVPDIADWGTDTLGAFVGAAIALAILARLGGPSRGAR